MYPNFAARRSSYYSLFFMPLKKRKLDEIQSSAAKVIVTEMMGYILTDCLDVRKHKTWTSVECI
jgi:hypothetical protein